MFQTETKDVRSYWWMFQTEMKLSDHTGGCSRRRQRWENIPVDVPDGDEDVGAGGNVVAAENIIINCATNEHRRLRIQPHGLVDDARRETQRPKLVHVRFRIPDHLVYLQRFQRGVSNVGRR